MLPWYIFTMVHLILSKPLWWQWERRASAYVSMYSFFFFPSQGCENTCWKTQKSPTNSRISSFSNLKKHQIFEKYFVHIKTNTKQKPPTNLFYKSEDRKESQLLREKPYWFVSPWSYSETTTALYKQYRVVNLLFFKYKYALRTDGKRELVLSNQTDPTYYTISPKDEGFSRKEHFTSLLDMLILILRKYSVICSISFWFIFIIT